MQLYPLAIAAAKIRHRRYLPRAHDFSSSLNYLWFDPDQIDEITQRSWLWTSKGWNILSLDAQDFLTMHEGTIRQKIAKQLLKQNLILADHDLIRVLALPRSLGFRFNSVVFYFIFDAQQQLNFVLSEITNIPWKERQVYVHDCRTQQQYCPPYQSYAFEFEKSFHVSPFMPMTLDYRWRFSFAQEQAVIHMQLWDQQRLQFDATMQFSLDPITVPSQQHRYAMTNMFEPFRMVFGIYLHAWHLWRKNIPFYRHPKKAQGNRWQ